MSGFEIPDFDALDWSYALTQIQEYDPPIDQHSYGIIQEIVYNNIINILQGSSETTFRWIYTPQNYEIYSGMSYKNVSFEEYKSVSNFHGLVLDVILHMVQQILDTKVDLMTIFDENPGDFTENDSDLITQFLIDHRFASVQVAYENFDLSRLPELKMTRLLLVSSGLENFPEEDITTLVRLLPKSSIVSLGLSNFQVNIDPLLRILSQTSVQILDLQGSEVTMNPKLLPAAQLKELMLTDVRLSAEEKNIYPTKLLATISQCTELQSFSYAKISVPRTPIIKSGVSELLKFLHHTNITTLEFMAMFPSCPINTKSHEYRKIVKALENSTVRHFDIPSIYCSPAASKQYEKTNMYKVLETNRIFNMIMGRIMHRLFWS